MLLFSSLVEQFQIPLPPFLLFFFLIFLFVAWGIYSFVLRYHWKKYATSKLDVMQMDIIYFIGSGVLLVAMAIAALLYSMTSTTL